MPPERRAIYVDEDVDRFVVTALRQRGFDVLATDEAGRQGATDEEQLAHAAALGCVLLTHNRLHFSHLHRSGQHHAGIAIVPQSGSVDRRALRAAMLVDWLSVEGDPTSRLAVWGHLQSRLQHGFRLEGYAETDVQLVLGRGEV